MWWVWRACFISKRITIRMHGWVELYRGKQRRMEGGGIRRETEMERDAQAE